MSEEAAFLMALKANPADDTARLVYADWLDEHDQPQKAEYLRAVVGVARAPEDAAASERLLAAVPHADLDWRLEAGARFALILDGYTEKIRAIKWLREVTGLGLAEAKRASESLPYTVLDVEPWDTAHDERAKGPPAPVVQTRLVPVQGPPHDSGERYGIHVRCSVYGRHGATEAEVLEFRVEARAALARLIDVARDLALEPNEPAGAEYVLLGSGLTRSEIRRVRAQLNAQLPAYDAARGWGIWLHTNVTT